MILADTSVWVDHLRKGDPRLVGLLDTGQVLTHPFVIGELALGHLRHRETVVALLQDIPSAVTATDGEVLHFIEQHRLYGLGIGYVDAHLVTATLLTPGALLWTRDKVLLRIAERLGLVGTYG